jgi:hypothetical protein
MVREQGSSRWRNQGGQASEQLHGIDDERCRPVAPEASELVERFTESTGGQLPPL